MATNLICSIPECGKKHIAHGLCMMHYTRVRNHGTPFAKGTTPNGIVRRFYETVVLPHKNENDCLLWPYSIGRNGYGQMAENGKMRTVSRLVCENVHGTPPTKKHHAAHSCGIRACVNPMHLRWATPVENASDKILHGTHNRGEKCHFSTLTEQQVREILELKGKETQESIANRYGVTFHAISSIHRRTSWSWLNP